MIEDKLRFKSIDIIDQIYLICLSKNILPLSPMISESEDGIGILYTNNSKEMLLDIFVEKNDQIAVEISTILVDNKKRNKKTKHMSETQLEEAVKWLLMKEAPSSEQK